MGILTRIALSGMFLAVAFGIGVRTGWLWSNSQALQESIKIQRVQIENDNKAMQAHKLKITELEGKIKKLNEKFKADDGDFIVWNRNDILFLQSVRKATRN